MDGGGCGGSEEGRGVGVRWSESMMCECKKVVTEAILWRLCGEKK